MSRRGRVFIPRADRRLGDRYELLECLGDGSYGWVWRALRLADGQVVAVKLPREQGARNEDLMEGSPLVGRDPHPNVIQLFWMGRVPPEREWYAIEMEYFPSATLARLLDDGPEGFIAGYDRVLDLYAQVLAGVRHLHSLGMSHGDIKPQNILVAGSQAKLADFGSSLAPDELYVRTRDNGGTILYSAPEAVGTSLADRDFPALVSADVYSLGVLLYQLLTASLPHDTLSQVARHTPFPRPREVNSAVCPALEDLTLRCLEGDPAGRWPGVAQLEAAFDRARRAQAEFRPLRIVDHVRAPHKDWSSQAMQLLDRGEYSRAEAVTAAEFRESADPQAYLMMATAIAREGRFFDCLRELEARPERLEARDRFGRALRRIALRCEIETRQFDRAERTIGQCLAIDGVDPDLVLKQASVLGLQARYGEASRLLLQLNREHPRRPAVLRRLVLVFEQLRDTGKALAFLRSYAELSPDDPWAAEKLREYETLGLL